MKLTNRELLDASQAIRGLVDMLLKLGMMRSATRYGLTARYLEPYGEEIVAARNALIKKHAGDKDRVEPGTQEHDAFKKDMGEYLACEVDVDIGKIVVPNNIWQEMSRPSDIYISLLPILDLDESESANGQAEI